MRKESIKQRTNLIRFKFVQMKILLIPILTFSFTMGQAPLPRNLTAEEKTRLHEIGISRTITDPPDSVVYAPEALDLCVHVAGGPERVLYGSDYPHNIGDMEGCLARVNGLKPADAKCIAGTNAERLFGL